MQRYLEDERIVKFMAENGLTRDNLRPFLNDIRIYLNNPEDYAITWSFGLHLNRVVKKRNPGINYVFNPLFSENIALKDLDLVNNTSKLAAIKNVREYPNKGLFLTGPNGIGKTHLVIALANEYYKIHNVKTLYITMPELVYQFLAFKENHVLLNKICNAERLIIDEIGNERISEWSRDTILLPIITKRIDRKLHTDIVSNYSVDELAQRYTVKAPNDNKSVKTLVSKMTALATVAVVVGKDYRNES